MNGSEGTAATGRVGSLAAARPASAEIVVLDSNVWLDLLLFADARCQSLREALDAGHLRPVVDSACLHEWQRLLGYRQWRLPAERQQALSAAVEAFLIESTELPPAALPRCRDPDDQKFLDLAARSRALLLLTRDRDLLMLARLCRRRGLFHILEPEALAAGLPPRLLPPSASVF